MTNLALPSTGVAPSNAHDKGQEVSIVSIYQYPTPAM